MQQEITSEIIIKIKQIVAENIGKRQDYDLEVGKRIIKETLEKYELNYIYDIFLNNIEKNEPLYISLENILFSEMYKDAIINEYIIKQHDAVMFLAFTLETNEILLNKIYLNNEVNEDVIKKEFEKTILKLLNLFGIDENKKNDIINSFNNDEKNIRYIIKKELL